MGKRYQGKLFRAYERKTRKFYERARDLGVIYKVPDKEYPGTALWAVKVYHPEVLTDYVEDTFEDIELLEKYEEAPWGGQRQDCY